MSTCLVCRPDAPLPELAEFAISYTDPDLGLVLQEARWATKAASMEGLHPELLGAIESEEPVLITAAMGKEIGDRAKWLVELVARRPAGAETVLLACENDLDPAYERIAAGCAHALRVLPCVVDRICAWPSTGQRDSLGRRVVVAHPVGEWVIPVTGTLPRTVAVLSRASLVQVSADPIDGFRARKLWTVNGVHIVLALIARQSDIDALPLTEAYGDDFVRVARPLMHAISQGLVRRWPAAPATEEYISQRVRAFLEAPDTTDRLLKAHLIRSDLRSFMKRLDTRLGEPARAAHEAGADISPFYAAMALAVEVLGDLKLYYPTGDEASLDPAVDEVAVNLFAKALSGWLEPVRAEDLVNALRRSLHDHYARIKPHRS